MAASDSASPSYASPSPVGFHITSLVPFLESPHIASISESSERQHWGTETGMSQIEQFFPDTPAGINSLNLLLYNKTRDTDRICPSCRRWYKFGESEQHYTSFDEFVRREPPISTAMSAEQKEEQDLSGICSQACMNAMMEGPVEAERTSGKELKRSGPWRMRRTTLAEEVENGVKIVWELVEGS